MLRMKLLRVSGVLLFVGLLGLAGCSGARPVTIQGKLIMPKNVPMGEPTGKEGAQDTLTLTFLKEGEDKAFSIQVNPKELTFESKEIIPGKYKVGFQVGLYAMPTGNPKRQYEVQMFNKAHAAQSSKMTYEVTAESPQSITVDLTKEQVTRN
jgi:hypothetical protein